MFADKSEIITLYDENSVRISKLIRREFNNPLGEHFIDLFEKYILSLSRNTQIPLNILDIGCGRAALAILLAKKYQCDIDGIELSTSMLEEAQSNISRSELLGKINLIQEDFFTLDLKNKKYDLLIGMDVFAYFNEQDILFRRLFQIMANKGLMIFSDYFCSDEKNEQVLLLTNRWKINCPGEWAHYDELLQRNNFKIIEKINTTSIYYNHWEEMRKRCSLKRQEIIAACGEKAFDNYTKSVDSILAAVNTNCFGHLVYVGAIATM